MTEAQIAELAAWQELRRVHGTFGRIFEDLDLVLAALRAEREAREKLNADCSNRIGELLLRAEQAERELAGAIEEAASHLRLLDRIARLIGLPDDEEMTETSFVAWATAAEPQKMRDAVAELDMRQAVVDKLQCELDDAHRISASWRKAATDTEQRATTAEEAVRVLHTALCSARRWNAARSIGIAPEAYTAVQHPAVVAVMQRQEPAHG